MNLQYVSLAMKNEMFGMTFVVGASKTCLTSSYVSSHLSGKTTGMRWNLGAVGGVSPKHTELL
jgi:hypothetical protein